VYGIGPSEVELELSKAEQYHPFNASEDTYGELFASCDSCGKARLPLSAWQAREVIADRSRNEHRPKKFWGIGVRGSQKHERAWINWPKTILVREVYVTLRPRPRPYSLLTHRMALLFWGIGSGGALSD
jgi:hypothetical protein